MFGTGLPCSIQNGLLPVELLAGHGEGTPISKRIDEVADTWAFLAEVFDMKVEPVK